MEALQKTRSWILASAVLGALLLLPLASGAAGIPGPIDDLTHFILDQAPYQINGGSLGGTAPPVPNVNAPNVPVQSLLDGQFIRLTRDTDFTLNLVEVLPSEPDTSTASPLNALRYNYTYEIGWNGTVGGLAPIDYLDENEFECEGFDGCDLMRDQNGDVRILFVIYSARWDVDGTCCDGTPFGQLPVVLGGFEAASFMTNPDSDADVTSPMLVTDAVASGMLGSNPGFFEVDAGVGVKFHLNEDGTEVAIFDVDWMLAQDGESDFGANSNTVIQQQIAAYVYTIPEPMTGLLLLSGLVGLTLAGRRQN